MDPHHTARLLAIGRMIVGIALLTAPRLATRPLVDNPSRAVGVLARAAGARDFVLGYGAFSALADGRDAARWVKAGAVADVADAAALAAASRELGPAAAIGGGLVAAAAAVVGFRAADDIDR